MTFHNHSFRSYNNNRKCFLSPPSGRPVGTTRTRRLVGATGSSSWALAPLGLSRLPGRSPAVGRRALGGLGCVRRRLCAGSLATQVRREVASLLGGLLGLDRLWLGGSGSSSLGLRKLASGLQGLAFAPGKLLASLALEVELGRTTGRLGGSLERTLESPAGCRGGTTLLALQTLLLGLFNLLDIEAAAEYMPFQALDGADGTGGGDLLEYGPALAVTLGWITLLGAFGLARTRRRDIS